MNDSISAFKWSLLDPVTEKFEDVVLDLPDQLPNGQTIVDTVDGVNEFDFPQTHVLKVEQEDALTISTTVTQSQTVTFGVSATTSVTPPEKTGGAGSSLTVTFETSLTATYERTVTTTETTGISVSQQVVIDPRSEFAATLIVTTGELPSTPITSKVERCYQQRVRDSVQIEESGLFCRNETITTVISGDAAFKTAVSTKQTSLDDPCLEASGSPGDVRALRGSNNGGEENIEQTTASSSRLEALAKLEYNDLL